MRVHFVVHEPFEAPGAYETWVRDRGYEATYSRVYLNEPMPQPANDIDLLIVLGDLNLPTRRKQNARTSRPSEL